MLNSTFMMEAIVILVTFKIFVSTSAHTFLSVLFQILSVMSFHMLFAILSQWQAVFDIDSYQLVGMFPILMTFTVQYLLLYPNSCWSQSEVTTTIEDLQISHQFEKIHQPQNMCAMVIKSGGFKETIKPTTPGTHKGKVIVGLEVDMNPLFALAPPAYRVHERVPDEVRGLAFRALDVDRAQRAVRIVCRQL